MLYYYSDTKFIILPNQSGWFRNNNENIIFAEKNIIDPYLDFYYSQDIKKRRLLKTNRALDDIAKEYSKLLPNHWKYKLLAVMRVASLLLYFFKENDIEPDCMFIIESASELNSKAIIALTQTNNYTSFTAIPLPSTKTKIINILSSSNDGTVLFRDSSLVEDDKKLNMSIDLLKDDINYSDTENNKSRHLIAVISNNPANISYQTPAMKLSFNASEQELSIQKIQKLQKTSGEFDYTLIQHIINNSTYFIDKINNSIKYSNLSGRDFNSKYHNTTKIIDLTMALIKEYGLISNKEIDEIYNWFDNNDDLTSDISVKIVNEFSDVLNKLIHHETIKIVRQYGSPFYNPNQAMIFETDEYLNFGDPVLKHLIPIRMTTTKRHTKILAALNEKGKLPPSKAKFKENKRTIEVFITPNKKEYVSVYSISKSLLDNESINKFNSVKNTDISFKSQNLNVTNFIPMISINENYVSGLQITPESEENFHIYVTGSTGSGKTFFLL